MFLKILILLVNVNYLQSCPVYLTIGLNGKTYMESNLELNWPSDCYTRPEWIGLYKTNPALMFNQPLVRLENINSTVFKMPLKHKVGKLRFPFGWNRLDNNNNNNNSKNTIKQIEYPNGKCLNYYVATFNGNELLTVECIKIYPHWLTRLENLKKLPLKDLFIPGTHASGAYVSSNYGESKTVFTKDFAVTQYFDIWSQLVFGIRYLDLTIGFKINDDLDANIFQQFWIVNENMFVNPLRYVLKDIYRFVNLTGEIVIVDFSSFPIGFYKHPERHKQLIHIIKQELGTVAYEYSNKDQHNGIRNRRSCDSLTIEEITKTGKTLIILYPLDELPYPENELPILCPTWKHFSTKSMNISQIANYMRLLFSKKKSSPIQDEGWIFTAIKNLEHSLLIGELQTARERAAHINPKLNNWLRGPWGSKANVVSLDYFRNTNIIDVAIYANLQKAFRRANKNFINFEIYNN